LGHSRVACHFHQAGLKESETFLHWRLKFPKKTAPKKGNKCRNIYHIWTFFCI
jgi:hypothetical protein